MKKLSNAQKKWALTGGLFSALLFNVSFFGHQVADYNSLQSADFASTENRIEGQLKLSEKDDVKIQYIKNGDNTTAFVPMASDGTICLKDCTAQPVVLKVPFSNDINALNDALLNQIANDKLAKAQEAAAEKASARIESGSAKPVEKESKEEKVTEKEKEKDEKSKEEIRDEKIEARYAAVSKRCGEDYNCAATKFVDMMNDLEKKMRSSKEKNSKVNKEDLDAELKIARKWYDDEVIGPMTKALGGSSKFSLRSTEEDFSSEDDSAEREKAVETIRLIVSKMPGSKEFQQMITKAVNVGAASIRSSAMKASLMQQRSNLYMNQARQTTDPSYQMQLMEQSQQAMSQALLASQDSQVFAIGYRNLIQEELLFNASAGSITYPYANSVMMGLNRAIENANAQANRFQANGSASMTGVQNASMNVMNPTVSNGRLSASPGVSFGTPVLGTNTTVIPGQLFPQQQSHGQFLQNTPLITTGNPMFRQ